MAQVTYVDNADRFSVLLDPVETAWVTRLIGNGQTRGLNELITDWIRIKAHEVVDQDKAGIVARLDTASAVEIATVRLALKMNAQVDMVSGPAPVKG